ncbi:MAG TPA: hypothetical protein VGB15_03330 [Longimicrobium sp.]|jgi:hypothetical protein
MKRKLRLQIEKLRVEQFEVQSASPAARGTVDGFESGNPSCTTCGIGASEPWNYCDIMPGTQPEPCL